MRACAGISVCIHVPACVSHIAMTLPMSISRNGLNRYDACSYECIYRRFNSYSYMLHQHIYTFYIFLFNRIYVFEVHFYTYLCVYFVFLLIIAPEMSFILYV